MAIHKVIIDNTEYSIKRRSNTVTEYHLDVPLPKDEFSCVVISYDGHQVITNEPFVKEGIVVVPVRLETTVFPETFSDSKKWKSKVFAATQRIDVAAKVQMLCYGGHLFLYGGIVDINWPGTLPLKVLEWKVECSGPVIKYQSHDKERWCYIQPIPSMNEVCYVNGKVVPNPPFVGIEIQRYYFQHWLKNRSLTLEDVRTLYEKEVIVPYNQAQEVYLQEKQVCRDFYDAWLERQGVILQKVEEIWDYLVKEALPQAAQAVKENARKVLEKVGHLEFID